MPPAWHKDAACAQVGVGMADAFFGDQGQPADLAKSICAGCPVRDLCGEYALAHDEHGVWGAMTRRERLVMQGRWAA